MPLCISKPNAGRSLSFADRQEIALLLAHGRGAHDIAREMERGPSTVARELQRNAPTRSARTASRA
ncbi:helix-turn-helix domain-containing protein [Pandoraea sputorum]|uniref:helix-turn-helix domain-containing protein n=1 Tax=Pandoraea sputorum TaxID=93222 RepID=UPI00123F90D4